MTHSFPVPPLDPHELDPVYRLAVYRLAVEAMRIAQADAENARGDALRVESAGQLVRAVSSIAANISEGYSRGGTADRRRFFEFALGSARESTVWYEAVAPAELQERLARLTSIRRLLLTMIRTARASAANDRRSFGR